MAIGDGKKIAIRFTEALVGDVSGLTPSPLGYKYEPFSTDGATITALNRYSSSYSADNAFDGNISTCWRGTTIVNWIQIQYASANVVKKVRMYFHSSNYINSFTVSGSNDGENFTQIGETYQFNVSEAGWYETMISNDTAYLYYRVDTLSGPSSSIYLYELELCEEIPLGNESKFTVTFQEYNFVPGGTLQSAEREVASVSGYVNIDRLLDLSSGTLTDLTYDGGSLTLEVIEEEEDGELQ